MPQIHITVDTNDADYVTEVSQISQEDLDKIRPLIEAIKDFKPYMVVDDAGLKWTHDNNYPFAIGEDYCCREDLGEKRPFEIYPQIDEGIFELFGEHLPYPEYGFHTIKKIIVYPDSVGEQLL